MKPHKAAPRLTELFPSIRAKAIAWEGVAFRAVGTDYGQPAATCSPEKVPNVTAAGGTPPDSFATVHASLDTTTAVAEALGTRRHYAIGVESRLPLTLVAIDVRLEGLIDLTDELVLAHLELTRRKLSRCRWRESMNKAREALTQTIGRIAFEQGLEGLLVPSAQVRQRRNLIVFPANLQRHSLVTIQNAHKLPPH